MIVGSKGLASTCPIPCKDIPVFHVRNDSNWKLKTHWIVKLQ